MGAPPNEKVSDGRGNPKGISYLYTANSIETAIYEVRPYLEDKITVAEGITKKR